MYNSLTHHLHTAWYTHFPKQSLFPSLIIPFCSPPPIPTSPFPLAITIDTIAGVYVIYMYTYIPLSFSLCVYIECIYIFCLIPSFYFIQPSESSALLPMESLFTLIVTICLGASEDVSVKTYFMNGPLCISKPRCYTNLTIEIYVMSTGNTNESSLENTPLNLPVHV